MREIKFRGKDKLGRWQYGDLVHDTINSANQIIEVGIKEARCYAVEVLPETVGQFTGRKTKDNKEIYEGDKAQRHNGEGEKEIFVVIWDERYPSFWLRLLESEDKYRMVKSNFEILDDIEIIGNIHEATNE